MFNWLGNLFPYSDLHSLNLDWILTTMKETAAQAAKAVADAANAIAQVAEAKAAALSAQTAAQNAQTAAQNAQTAAQNAQTAADSAENAVAVAQTAAQTAQNTAENALTAAENARTTAEGAQTTANSVMEKFPIVDRDIERKTITGDAIANNTITKDKFKSVQFNVYDPIYSDFHFDVTVEQLNAGTTPVNANASTFTHNILAIYLYGSYPDPSNAEYEHHLTVSSGVFTRPQTTSYVEIDVKLTDLYAPGVGAETIRVYNGKFIIKTIGTNYKLWFTFNNTIDAQDISAVKLTGYIRYLSAV